MVEQGAKKRVVACAFDWPGWDRSVRHGGDVLAMLESYRPRYALVAQSAGYGEEFAALGRLRVVEELEGTGMTDYYGVSGRTATGEVGPMSEAELERKVALLEAAWRTFDETAARVSPELRLGPRGGGRSRDEIVGHVNRAEIGEFSPKVGVKAPIETWEDRGALLAYRRDVVAGGVDAATLEQRIRDLPDVGRVDEAQAEELPPVEVEGHGDPIGRSGERWRVRTTRVDRPPGSPRAQNVLSPIDSSCGRPWWRFSITMIES